MLLDWKSFYADLSFVTFWKLTAVTLLLHADWMMLKNASNQRRANSVTLNQLWALVAWKDAFLENYLAIIAEQRELQTKGTFLLTEN